MNNPELIERVARAICEADELAPEPDAKAMRGMKECRAWELRIPQAQAALSTMNGEALENKLVEAYEHGWDEGAESAVEEGQMPHHDTKNEGSGLYRQAIQREALDRPLAFTLATLRAKESE